MLLRKIFSTSITFTMTCEYGKYAGVKIDSAVRPVYQVACQWVISNVFRRP